MDKRQEREKPQVKQERERPQVKQERGNKKEAPGDVMVLFGQEARKR